MNIFIEFLKEKRKAVIIFAVCVLLFCLSFYLYGLPLQAVLYPSALCVLIYGIYTAFEYIKLRQKLKELNRIKSHSAQMIEFLPKSTSLTEKEYQNIIKKLLEEITEEKAKSYNKYAETVDYYTVWVHQIKTPIASMKLSLQNDTSNLSRKLSAELLRIEQYVEMVLAFLRLGSESTDYIFKEYSLDEIIRSSVKKFAGEFIDRKLTLNYEPVNHKVISDEKWLSFVVEQIISNALKYTKEGSITICMSQNDELLITDTGIGIQPEDLPRIFEKGYTGKNGRSDKSASGLGLYLCKCICANLNIDISATSVICQGTTVKLQFPENGLTKM